MAEIDDQCLEDLYAWIDTIPLSRPKKNLTRDFSDGVLVAEVVKHFLPKWVELHNYPPANKFDGKMTNWNLLNRKVFKRLGFELGKDVVDSIVKCSPWAVEQMLMMLRRKIEMKMFEEKRADGNSDKPEADQVADPAPSGKPAQQSKGVKGNQAGDAPTGKPLPASLMAQLSPDQKIILEEKEQELLSKHETIQILGAKVRRLEHLLHLKDIRIDDLQSRIEVMESKMRPSHRPVQK